MIFMERYKMFTGFNWLDLFLIRQIMEKYSDYIIVHAANADDLRAEVTQHLKDGWILLGAPFSHTAEDGSEICQALIKQDATRPGAIGFSR